MSSAPASIDVWDIGTFDADLLAQLRSHTSLVRHYFTTEHQIFLDHGLGRPRKRAAPRPENPSGKGFSALKDTVGRAMAARTIRAWHYTRLTDVEAAAMQLGGIHMSTPATLRTRLDALVAAGDLSQGVADAAYRASPFHEQLKIRSERFWMTSHPIAIDDSLVSRLLAYWGGEVASFWTSDPALLEALGGVGRPRVVELAMPLSAAGEFHGHSAAAAVLAAFGRSIGCIPDKHAFDLYAVKPLPGAAVLAVHTEGDRWFSRIGRDFPSGFVDLDVGRWKELTGEDGE